MHARWEREDEIARKNNIARVYTITTSENASNSSVNKPPTINGKIVGVGNVSTSIAKCHKLPDNSETVLDKDAEISSNKEDNNSITFDNNDFDFDGCNISEVIKFFQKLARSPNASAINMSNRISTSRRRVRSPSTRIRRREPASHVVQRNIGLPSAQRSSRNQDRTPSLPTWL